jgi:hypothetical protein
MKLAIFEKTVGKLTLEYVAERVVTRTPPGGIRPAKNSRI